MKSKNISIWRELGNRSSKDISIERKQYLNKLKIFHLYLKLNLKINIISKVN